MIFIQNDITKDGKYNFVKLNGNSCDIKKEIDAIIFTLEKAKLDILKFERCSK